MQANGANGGSETVSLLRLCHEGRLVGGLSVALDLTPDERSTFLHEFIETVEACAAIDSNAPLAQLIHEWKATASIYSDPQLAARLKRPSRGTTIRVSRPALGRR